MKPGDYVEHKSGGPVMVVSRILPRRPWRWRAYVECNWYHKGWIHTQEIEPCELKGWQPKETGGDRA